MSLKFNNLKLPENSAYSTERYTYTDLNLDMSFNLKDINVSPDQQAIRNALVMLLNTYPGENILYPDLGINLHENLFDQLTQANGYALGIKISQAIENFEPRVIVESVTVFVIPEQQAYQINMIIRIPNLKYTADFTGIFDRTRFTLLTE